MKTKILWKWSLGLSFAVLLFLGCGQKSANLAEGAALDTESVISGESTNAPSPAEMEQDLESAPAQVVSAPKAPANTLSVPASEVVKLAQAGVDESVMMAYVTNSTYVFNLSSDDIIYLNDIGVPGSVVTAMIQRDQSVRTAAANGATSAPPVYTNPPAGGAPTPYPTDQEPQSTEVVDNVEAAPQVNVSYSYFYDSLAPYGTWIYVEGYGRCWQPTVVVVNRDWQPYCDSGRWIYSDCGWYWASDYSWGWAPFHYGRWFHHGLWGWCWAPDTVWGPSWVSWRYTSGYCGWAPLPPSACYKPGVGFTYYGRSVGANFSFGLNSRHYAFVSVGNFYNRHPSHYRVPQEGVNRIYNNTVASHNYGHDGRNRIINRGIPIDTVRSATRTDIQPVQIHTSDRPVQNRITRGNGPSDRALAVYTPNLPQPTGNQRLVGEGVRLAPRQTFGRGNFAANQAGQTSPTVQQSGNVPSGSRYESRDRRGQPVTPGIEKPSKVSESSVPTSRNTTIATGNPGRGNGIPSRRPNEPLILRGPDRPVVAENNPAQTTAPQRNWDSPARVDGRGATELTRPTRPAWQPYTAPQANPTPTTPNRQQEYRPMQQTPAPVQVQPPQQNQRVYQQNTPVYRQPTPGVTPSAPVQRQPVAPSYQAPRVFEQPRYTPPVRSESPMPRMEPRQLPQVHNAPPVQQQSPPSSPAPSAPARSHGRNR